MNWSLHPFSNLCLKVGDGADYAVYDDEGYDPISLGKSWTSPKQDPQLNGNEPRKVGCVIISVRC